LPFRIAHSGNTFTERLMTRLTLDRTYRFAALALMLTFGAAPAQAQGATATGRSYTLNGIEMYVETHGSGDPLVLLHGFGGAGAMWGTMVQELATQYRVIVPDLRGHGRSTNPSRQFTHRQSALDVLALMDSLGITRFKAMGISTGGMTLLHVATREPSRIEAMVLIGATIYFPEQARVIMRASTVDRLRPADYERGRRIHARGDEQTRELEEQFHAFKDSYDDMNFTRPFLSTISARTLIVHGDRDEFFPVEIPLEMYRGIPNAELWIIPGGYHVPIFDPAVPFVARARAFLK
jgi:pimeloyl-ACP methyl ester carboxylesterase